MSKRQEERLLKLADWLSQLKTKAFNLRLVTGLNVDWDTQFSLEPNVVYPLTNAEIVTALKGGPDKAIQCGAAACAIGWCPTVFPRSFIWDRQANVRLKSKRVLDFDAVASFFSISHEASIYLFSPYEYYDRGKTSPKQVARRIREFVGRGCKMPKERI